MDRASPAPSFDPCAVMLRGDAERLFAERLVALNAVLDALEDEGAAAIAAAVSGGDADPQLVATAFMEFTKGFARRLEAVAAIPAADLAAAIERARGPAAN